MLGVPGLTSENNSFAQVVEEYRRVDALPNPGVETLPTL